jgi:hypothetical protein
VQANQKSKWLLRLSPKGSDIVTSMNKEVNNGVSNHSLLLPQSHSNEDKHAAAKP